jgi:hypothetical protein
MADPGRPRAVLLMARAPRPGTVRTALETMLGAERCGALQATLIRLAAAWAGQVAPGRLHVAYEPPDAGPEMRALLGRATSVLPQNGVGISGRIASAAGRLFAQGAGPVLIMWPDLLHWRPEHAEGALADLQDGCGVSLGPVFDGGFYLVGLARPLPALFELPEESWRSPDAMTLALTAAHAAGVEVGLLRTERALHRPEDVRAALADPLTDPGIRALLK